MSAPSATGTPGIALQLVIDCADPTAQAHFWASALRWQLQPPPDGAASWRDYYRSIGVPEDELGDGDCTDRIVDPSGNAPPIWFQQVPERKTVKNRLHLDLKVGGGRAVPLAERRVLVDIEVRRLTEAGARSLYVMDPEAMEHYSVTMADPEGNEFCVV